MQIFPLADGATGQSEDCLNLNILTPEGVTGTNSNLPVMVWL
jgi:carboxylesterase type B